MTTNRGAKAKRQGATRRRRKIPAPKTFAEVSTADARQRLNRSLIEAEVGKKLTMWVNDPPPQMAATMKDLIDAFMAGFRKGIACEANRQCLEQAENTLENYGSQYSAEDYQELEGIAEKCWEEMVKLGC